MPVSRVEVFSQISEERAQQDLKHTDDAGKSIGDWLVIADGYLRDAFQSYAHGGGVEVLHQVRRVAAILVTCLEYHGDKIGIGEDANLPDFTAEELDNIEKRAQRQSDSDSQTICRLIQEIRERRAIPTLESEPPPIDSPEFFT